MGFYSSYHSTRAEAFGRETSSTLFHTKNELKPYHIDYVYLKGLNVADVEIGIYRDWISYSDHMPIIADCLRT